MLVWVMTAVSGAIKATGELQIRPRESSKVHRHHELNVSLSLLQNGFDVFRTLSFQQ